MNNPEYNGRSSQSTPDETGLLAERYEDGQRIFDIGTPSLRELSRRVAVGAAGFLLLWGVLTVAGAVPLNPAAILGFGGLGAMLVVAAMLDYYRQSQQDVSLLASEGRLLVQNHIGGLWKHTNGRLSGTSGHLIAGQPLELYCSNAGRLRLPFFPRQLIIVTDEIRVQAGRHLSSRELSYVFDEVCATTGWQEVQRVGPFKRAAAVFATLTVGFLAGHWFGHLAYQYGIAASVTKGRVAAGVIAALLTGSLFYVLNAIDLRMRQR